MWLFCVTFKSLHPGLIACKAKSVEFMRYKIGLFRYHKE
nr:MAG TPA: hypothetical protein [Caudoviricetes sp.]